MRVKIDHIVDGNGLLPEIEYAPILTMPEMVDSSNKHLAIIQFPRKASGRDKFQMELLALFRTILNEPESEPRENGQGADGGADDSVNGIEEEDESELVDPKLREMRRELDKLDQSDGSPNSIGARAEVAQDEDDVDELEALRKEGSYGCEEDSSSDSTELDEDGENSSTEGEAREDIVADDWGKMDEDEDEDEDTDETAGADDDNDSAEEAGNLEG